LILGLGAHLFGAPDSLTMYDGDEFPYNYGAVTPAPGALQDNVALGALNRSGLTNVATALANASPAESPRVVSADNANALLRLWTEGQGGDAASSAALIRACVTHEYQPVRVASAAIWSLANPGDVPAGTVLFQALDSASESARGIARTVLESGGYSAAQVEPPPSVQPPSAPDQLKPVSLMVHGTWAYDERWWRPGIGDFHRYIKSGVRPNLWARPSVYYWSGRYQVPDRDWAVHDLLSWAGQHCLRGVDTIFAHSYGGQVAMRAVAAGLGVRTLVFLSTPFFADDKPSLLAIQGRCRIRSFRTKGDIVLGANKLTRFLKNPLSPKSIRPPFSEKFIGGMVTGHSATHDPDTWRNKGLAALI